MKTIFKNRNFKLLFFGNLVSEIGNSLFAIAMSFYILDLTDGNGIAMGTFLFVSMGMRVLVSPMAGVLVEKWNRVRIIYITDFLRAFAFLALGYFVTTDQSTSMLILSLYAVSIFSNLNAAFFGPAMSKALPEIVGDDQIQAAQGASSIVGSVQNIVGVLAGAALYAFVGVYWVIMINAVSFFFSGVSEMFIKTPFKHVLTEAELEKQKTSSHMQDFKDSIQYIKERTGLFTMMGYSLVMNFAVTPLFAIAAPYLFKTDLARVNAEMEYAYTEVAFSVMMLIAGILVGSMKFKSLYHTIRKSFLALSLAFAYLALMMSLVSLDLIDFWLFYGFFILGILVIGWYVMFVNVPINTSLIKAVHPSYRGRVFSTIGALSQAAVPFAMLAGGILVNFGIPVVAAFSVLMMFVPTLGYMNNKKVKILLTSLEHPEKQVA